MNICVPDIGQIIILTKPFTFRLHHERRNDDAMLRLTGHAFLAPHYRADDKRIAVYPADQIPTEAKQRGMLLHGAWCRDDWTEHQDAFDKMLADGFMNMEFKPGERFNDHTFSVEVTLPKGTELTVDRVYIRKGADEFSSYTFWIKRPEDKKKMRFWVKLADVNTMVGNLQEKKPKAQPINEPAKKGEWVRFTYKDWHPVAFQRIYKPIQLLGKLKATDVTFAKDPHHFMHKKGKHEFMFPFLEIPEDEEPAKGDQIAEVEYGWDAEGKPAVTITKRTNYRPHIHSKQITRKMSDIPKYK